jgi:transposase-like protein
LPFLRFPKAQWKTLRTTNTIERLREEVHRRVKRQGSRPKFRRIDGWGKIAEVLGQHTAAA